MIFVLNQVKLFVFDVAINIIHTANLFIDFNIFFSTRLYLKRIEIPTDRTLKNWKCEELKHYLLSLVTVNYICLTQTVVSFDYGMQFSIIKKHNHPRHREKIQHDVH